MLARQGLGLFAGSGRTFSRISLRKWTIGLKPAFPNPRHTNDSSWIPCGAVWAGLSLGLTGPISIISAPPSPGGCSAQEPRRLHRQRAPQDGPVAAVAREARL